MAHTKEAHADYNREWYHRNKEKVRGWSKRYVEENRDRVSASRRRYRENNKEKVKAAKRADYEKRKPAILMQTKAYKEARPEWYRETKRKYMEERRWNDPAFKMLMLLRGRIRCAIKAGAAYKAGRTVDLIGCSIKELMFHLQGQFQRGMTWKNQGKWHVDHIVPYARFNLLDPKEQRKCFHYTNLQPLWGIDNRRKGAKVVLRQSHFDFVRAA